MRLGLTQSLRAEQRLIQSPQMIQAMQVLQLPLIELKDQVEQELQENVFLERKDEAERSDPATGGDGPDDAASGEPEAYEDRLHRECSAVIDQLESRAEPSWRQRTGGLGQFFFSLGPPSSNKICLEFKLNMNSNENESKNATGEDTYAGALRVPRAGYPACVFAFVFV